MSEETNTNINGGHTNNRTKTTPYNIPNNPNHHEHDMRLWGILIFGVIGATATLFAIGQMRRSVDWFHSQERIRRMQSVFNREKNKHRRGYERWRDDGYGEYYQHFQRDDWYWRTDSSYGNWSNFKDTSYTPANYSLSHHYAVLGLARSRTTPYTDDEIKTAFRSKAKQYHPDQNQENKEAAEAKFKEIMTSYEAIKSERKNNIM
ncbi:hypothetical protein M8C21_010285 [Ambrosia artemisiifolia]|uniref:J domain-containing protein n=1 Tax=Ambrosia artemisiifolia TaxID=4212 RepID=A0AAD5CSL8_AMBAR|nr:hypothetical protein M8C21_010285 [Ambrosia artemisiifolia]